MKRADSLDERARAVDSAEHLLGDPACTLGTRLEALQTIGLVRARCGDPGVWEMLDEASMLAEPTGELQLIGPVAAARAEAAWLQGRSAVAAQATADALKLALERHDRWSAGELACWRWRTGVREELPAGAAAEPYALSMAGESARAAALWRKIGCPYEAALALADAHAEQPLRRALLELHDLGARAAAGIVAQRLRARRASTATRAPRYDARESGRPDRTRARSRGAAR